MTDEINASDPPAESAETETGDHAPASTKSKAAKASKGSGAPLPFEAELWRAADLLRGQLEEAEYKHVVLGLIFLKFVSESFEHRRAQIAAEVADAESPYYLPDPADQKAALEDRDFYASRNVAWIPAGARWSELQDNAKQTDIGARVDMAMDLIEKENPDLRGVLPKVYGRADVKPRLLGELIDLFSTVGVKGQEGSSEDILGRVYEYFLGNFGTNEGGQYYTPQHVVKLLVEMLQPYKGRVYDPCCGSGGMFVQSVKFTESQGGRTGDISVYGQENIATTWRLAKMNLAIRHIDANLGDSAGDSFHDDKHPDLRADFVIANPPFNMSDWGGHLLKQDPRWVYGTPPAGNANFAWVQHFLHHLAPTGTAGFVLANGALSAGGIEGEIRKSIVEANLVDCIVSLPGQLFFGTPIPVSLWFLSKSRVSGITHRDRILMIDGSKLGTMVDRAHRLLGEEDIARVAGTYHDWLRDPSRHQDGLGFSASVDIDRIRAESYVLSPARYVGFEAAEADAEETAAKVQRLVRQLRERQIEAERLDSVIDAALSEFGYGG